MLEVSSPGYYLLSPETDLYHTLLDLTLTLKKHMQIAPTRLLTNFTCNKNSITPHYFCTSRKNISMV